MFQPWISLLYMHIEILQTLPGRSEYPIMHSRTKREAELDAMPTPDTPYGCTWHHDPPPRLRKCIKRLVDSLPDIPDKPKSPKVKEMFMAFMEASREELNQYQKKHFQQLEKIIRKEKEKVVENEGQKEESEEIHHQPLINGNEKQEEEANVKNNKEQGDSLSHQLEELARASLVERSRAGAAGGRSKVPFRELQRPASSSKTHLIALESQPR